MPIVNHHRPTSTPASSDGSSTRSASLQEHARDGGFLDGLKKWGVTGAVVAGLVIPAIVAVQIVSAPRSPADLDVTPPAPPAISQPAQPQPPGDVFVPGRGGSPPVVSPAQPAEPVAPPVVPPAPTTQPEVPPVVAQPPVLPADPVAPGAPIAPGDLNGAVQRAFQDGVVTAAEAKEATNAVLQKGPNASVADWQLLTTVYVDGRTSADARRVLDAAFVRAGVPLGKGAAHIEQVVMRAVAAHALGAPLRGRLPTQNMMRLDLAPTNALPQGATVWTSPGSRPQAFIDIPGQGVFGPVAVAVRVGS